MRVRIVLACVLVSSVACAGTHPGPRPPASTVAFGENGAVLHVDIAATRAAQREGLMAVETLPEDQGMAFVFDEPVDSTFWMKDTLIPLSIAFVDADGTVIGMRDMRPCDTDPCPRYGIDEPYALAIEANLGWFQEHGVEVGSRAELRMGAYG